MSVNYIVSPWITCYVQRPNATVRLICIPHGGGGPQSYKAWAEQLPEHIEVLALSFPGRGSRHAETALRSMAPLADEVSKALKPYLNKPYALFGHSVGALIAYE
ncbi:MAG: putative thioesterase, partial [Acidobacteria bacterium]